MPRGRKPGSKNAIAKAAKPTPSIAQPQKTIDLEAKQNTTLEIHGRHDPCIVPRAVPVIEAVTAVTILDLISEGS